MDGPVGRMGPGEVLAGRYTLLSLLGQGGMSRVFLVEDRKAPGKRWAVKETYVGRESDLEYAGGGEKRLEAERRMRFAPLGSGDDEPAQPSEFAGYYRLCSAGG
ncbi:hypothetical protein LJK88_06035 [Paenibacillus sp. P26]|nr:hypothetical protein LJK88_06035 [Paenibacillus sp. P26]